MKYKLLLLILCLSGSLWAQEKPLQLSLEEAIVHGLENNAKVKGAALDIKAAKKQKWETTTMGLPQISAKIEYQNWLKQQVSLLPAAAFDPYNQIRDLGDYYNVTPVAGNPVPAAAEGFVPLRFGTKQTINATATLTQLLFDGSYLVGLQSAKVFLEITENAKHKTDLEIRKTIIDAYGNVLLVEESLKIGNKNKAALESTLYETQKIFENGLAEEEDVEQLQITLTQINSSINNTKRLKDISYKMLNIVLGNDIDHELMLTENLDALTEKNIELNLTSENFNIADNIDYKIAKNSEKSKELLLKLERSKGLPSLTAFLNAGYNGNNDEFRFLESQQEWFGSSLFGVSLNIPIFSSLGRAAATQRAKINYEKAQIELTDAERQIKLQVESAKSNYQFAIEEYGTAKQNLRLSERIENKNQIKYKEGIASSFELREAQTQLYTAQQSYLQAMVNVINNKAALESILKSNIIIK